MSSMVGAVETPATAWGTHSGGGYPLVSSISIRAYRGHGGLGEREGMVSCRWMVCGVAFVVGLFDGLGRFWKFKRSKAVQYRQSLSR